MGGEMMIRRTSLWRTGVQVLLQCENVVAVVGPVYTLLVTSDVQVDAAALGVFHSSRENALTTVLLHDVLAKNAVDAGHPGRGGNWVAKDLQEIQAIREKTKRAVPVVIAVTKMDGAFDNAEKRGSKESADTYGEVYCMLTSDL
eukprot:CAMPEP_0175836912 /NCGR_PEP_ID=MMETSP0107_2-20121207/17400_1 /TAXON_ID=195067 ORGANISM="Goniomonas pacifica, Strain CCMP1869" /NCGR_SAMPLE_ID=MMETSP0107_2 /ASSEMBLY_ACC=CAM_ASM_000203 /LENGTH=143 /DNA_ID=CAMNT_0017150347 /DNA_START=452 /DNA_END=885 /DNA_ORIENTATION=+